MPQFLLSNFLSDPAQYEQAELTWRQKWEAVVRAASQEEIWQTPWLNTRSNDGTLFRDGNPIFSAVCPTRHLGIRVIQVEPGDDPNELSEWTNTFGKGEPDAIRELVIHCVLTEQTLRRAEELMKGWVLADGCTATGDLEGQVETSKFQESMRADLAAITKRLFWLLTPIFFILLVILGLTIFNYSTILDIQEKTKTIQQDVDELRREFNNRSNKPEKKNPIPGSPGST